MTQIDKKKTFNGLEYRLEKIAYSSEADAIKKAKKLSRRSTKIVSNVENGKTIYRIYRSKYKDLSEQEYVKRLVQEKNRFG